MDRIVVERARHGDRDAYERLTASVARRLYLIAYRIVRDSDQAEDAVQQTLVAIWRELPSLREALAVADELAALLAGGEAPLASCAPSSPAASEPTPLDTPPYSLSRREHEILALLAQRLSDKEIAATLFISPRTVMTHATHIFAKLGVANRREAAAAATRHGLI